MIDEIERCSALLMLPPLLLPLLAMMAVTVAVR
jgi:hypothetical protein